MNAATALLQSAETHGITLWVDGDQLRYKARQPVTDGMKDRIRQHKAEIINLLSNQGNEAEKLDHSTVPTWCNPGCECLGRQELPDLPMVMGCYQENDERNWKWSRFDKMNGCPKATIWSERT